MTNMIEVKTADLIGPALDWAVGLVAGLDVRSTGRSVWIAGAVPAQSEKKRDDYWMPSTSWDQGGPLIDKYQIEFRYVSDNIVRAVLATGAAFIPTPYGAGETHLIAAMRAIVAAKLDLVGVPAELITQ